MSLPGITPDFTTSFHSNTLGNAEFLFMFLFLFFCQKSLDCEEESATLSTNGGGEEKTKDLKKKE